MEILFDYAPDGYYISDLKGMVNYKNMKQKLILFDIDGTLTATNAADAKCYSAAFEKTFRLPLPRTDWDVYEHCTDFAIAREVLVSSRGEAPSAPAPPRRSPSSPPPRRSALAPR